MHCPTCRKTRHSAHKETCLSQLLPPVLCPCASTQQSRSAQMQAAFVADLSAPLAHKYLQPPHNTRHAVQCRHTPLATPAPEATLAAVHTPGGSADSITKSHPARAGGGSTQCKTSPACWASCRMRGQGVQSPRHGACASQSQAGSTCVDSTRTGSHPPAAPTVSLGAAAAGLVVRLYMWCHVGRRSHTAAVTDAVQGNAARRAALQPEPGSPASDMRQTQGNRNAVCESTTRPTCTRHNTFHMQREDVAPLPHDMAPLMGVSSSYGAHVAVM